MKPARRRLLLIVVAVLGMAAIRATLLRPAPVPVTVYRVAPGRVEATVTNSKAGTIKTRRRASLSPEVGGRVEALGVRKGETVAAGRLLLRIASGDPDGPSGTAHQLAHPGLLEPSLGEELGSGGQQPVEGGPAPRLPRRADLPRPGVGRTGAGRGSHNFFRGAGQGRSG